MRNYDDNTGEASKSSESKLEGTPSTIDLHDYWVDMNNGMDMDGSMADNEEIGRKKEKLNLPVRILHSLQFVTSIQKNK